MTVTSRNLINDYLYYCLFIFSYLYVCVQLTTIWVHEILAGCVVVNLKAYLTKIHFYIVFSHQQHFINIIMNGSSKTNVIEHLIKAGISVSVHKLNSIHRTDSNQNQKLNLISLSFGSTNYCFGFYLHPSFHKSVLFSLNFIC